MANVERRIRRRAAGRSRSPRGGRLRRRSSRHRAGGARRWGRQSRGTARGARRGSAQIRPPTIARGVRRRAHRVRRAAFRVRGTRRRRRGGDVRDGGVGNVDSVEIVSETARIASRAFASGNVRSRRRARGAPLPARRERTFRVRARLRRRGGVAVDGPRSRHGMGRRRTRGGERVARRPGNLSRGTVSLDSRAPRGRAATGDGRDRVRSPRRRLDSNGGSRDVRVARGRDARRSRVARPRRVQTARTRGGGGVPARGETRRVAPSRHRDVDGERRGDAARRDDRDGRARRPRRPESRRRVGGVASVVRTVRRREVSRALLARSRDVQSAARRAPGGCV